MAAMNWSRARTRDALAAASRAGVDARQGDRVARASVDAVPPTRSQLRLITQLRAQLGLEPTTPPASRTGASTAIQLLRVRLVNAPVPAGPRRPPMGTGGDTPRVARQAPASPDALAVPCRRCGATVDEPCHDRSGRIRRPHAARIRALAAPQ